MSDTEIIGRECYLAKQSDNGSVVWWTGREWSADKSRRMEFASHEAMERHFSDGYPL